MFSLSKEIAFKLFSSVIKIKKYPSDDIEGLVIISVSDIATNSSAKGSEM